MVIVLLALAWAVVLVPSAMRPRFESSPLDGVRSFERSMGILANTRRGPQPPGRWVMVPKDLGHAPRRRRNRVIARRRRAFGRLILVAAATLALGLIPGLRVLLLAHLATDVVLAGYVAQLRRWRRNELQRADVVRPLAADPAQPPRSAAAAEGERASAGGVQRAAAGGETASPG